MMKLKNEARIQQEICMWMRNTYCLNHHDPQCQIFSVPNESSNVIEQIKKKGTGMMAGVSDLILVLPNKVIFCEVKDAKGKQKPAQIEFEKKVVALHHEYWLVRSLEQFQELITAELGDKK